MRLTELEDLAADDVLDLVETSDFLMLIRAVRALPGLLEIAETAMPDSYFATDSRVREAKLVLENFGEPGGAAS